MFDYHMHTTVSFDGIGSAQEMADAAVAAGLKEICFTDHWDDNEGTGTKSDLFSLDAYSAAYDGLKRTGLKIRRGIEFGLTTCNQNGLSDVLQKRSFDFVIGSIHYVDGADPYYADFWNGRAVKDAFESYLLQTLACVKVHDNFDVLGHLTYVCKSEHNPTHEPVRYEDFRDLADEIMRILAQNGKGMEINTSGVDRAGVFLPSAEYLRRFRELGGEIVTIGSDAHSPDRVGQYTKEGLEILKDIFGYVCTFEDRKPIFHKL